MHTTHRTHAPDHVFTERAAAIRSFAHMHRDACVRYAEYRVSHKLDPRGASLLDEVRLTRGMLVALVEDAFTSAANGRRRTDA